MFIIGDCCKYFNRNFLLSDDTTLVTMDIVILLEDGSICNVEVQKIGCAFPGERATCFSKPYGS